MTRMCSLLCREPPHLTRSCSTMARLSASPADVLVSVRGRLAAGPSDGGIDALLIAATPGDAGQANLMLKTKTHLRICPVSGRLLSHSQRLCLSCRRLLDQDVLASLPRANPSGRLADPGGAVGRSACGCAACGPRPPGEGNLRRRHRRTVLRSGAGRRGTGTLHAETETTRPTSLVLLEPCRGQRACTPAPPPP